jgi:tRNA threonylcarbamoyladenosine biosynthesis protein TsaB
MSSLHLLALETATDACSVALMVGNEVQERFEIAPRRHVALVLPFIESLLADAGLTLGQLDVIAFGRGPGSFTGLRIAAGMAQGIAFGADLPVVPVSTLAALAQGCVRGGGTTAVLAALDARMHEVYFGAYRAEKDGLVALQGDERVCAPASIPQPAGTDWFAAGDGWSVYREQLQARLPAPLIGMVDAARPHAADIAALGAAKFLNGEALPADQAAPVYLRNNVAARPGN